MSTSHAAAGISTGSVEVGNTVQNALAFDLTAVTTHHAIVAATLRVRNPPRGRVILSDPAQRVRYARSRTALRRGEAVPLNAAALRDLQCARGSFFWLDATLAPAHDDDERLDASACILDLTLVAATPSRAAAEHAAA